MKQTKTIKRKLDDVLEQTSREVNEEWPEWMKQPEVRRSTCGVKYNINEFEKTGFEVKRVIKKWLSSWGNIEEGVAGLEATIKEVVGEIKLNNMSENDWKMYYVVDK